MFYYLYQITNLVNNKIYVGVHKTIDINDGYMGSGKVIQHAFAKHGVDNFKKDILEYFENSDAMYAREKEIVSDDFLLREDVYNLRRGGKGGFDFINKTIDFTIRNTNASRKGRKKISSSIKKLWENGKYNDRVSIKSDKCTFLNKSHLEETKKKIGEKNSKLQSGVHNSQYGTMWITNGIKNKKIKRDIPIPEGWKVGRVYAIQESIRN